MLSSKLEHVETTLDGMWEIHKDYLRRCLVGLTRDLDLADDLLQETYLRARDGISGYRGGDARAWLAAIARNACFAHARRRYFSSEVPLETDACVRAGTQPGSTGHVDLIALRQAISDLPPALRDALIMKHYGGLTYSEIAERLKCPRGTAQQRVWTAIQRLRVALGVMIKETVSMKCSELVGKTLVDYLYGKLPEAKAEAIGEHLANCPECRDEAEETAGVLQALDAVEDALTATFILDFDREGLPTYYGTMSIPNLESEPVDIFEFGTNKDAEILYAAQNGDEAPIEELNAYQTETHRRYRLRLPHKVEPGEQFHVLLVARSPKGPGAEHLGNGIWQIGPCTQDYKLDSQDSRDLPGGRMVHVAAIRIPKGASLVEAKPEPTEVKTNGRTTVYWRNLLTGDYQVDYWVKYQL